MATLELKNLTKRFGKKVVAVDNISLEVEDGEFLVLLGPSGCGKTTTMRMVAGLEEVTAGEIILGGRDITDLPPRRRNVSMIFQNYAVWPHMTVYDNIAYALKLKHKPKDEIDKIVKDVAGLSKIEPYLERYPSQLSGGQQQRVAVARAIAVEPEVFLMDEPLSNLDAKLRVSMRTELKAIHNNTKATSVFVTHDQSEAMSMADRIVIMKDGEIMQIGTPEEVYNNSANLFVADFIGTPPTNFMDCDLVNEGENVVLINPHFKLSMNGALAQKLKAADSTEIVLGVRPENIILTTKEDALFSTECLVSEPQGSHQVVSTILDEKMIKIIDPSLPKVTTGETLHIGFKQETLGFFDKQSGNRI